MGGCHAFFEIVGMIAIGYIIARLVLITPIVKKSFIYRNKKRKNGANNPNPIIYSNNFEICKNVISNTDPVKDFNKSEDYPLSNNTLNMSTAPPSEKGDNFTHGGKIISKGKE